MIDQLLIEYDELVTDIQGSGYQTFPHNLQRWFSFLDSSASLAGILPLLESSVNFKTWYEKCLQTRSSMAGSAQLDWPEKTTQQLGLKLRLFRLLGNKNIQPHEFCSNFLYVEGDLNAMVANIIRQLFAPLGRELRRYIIRETERQQTFSLPIPATDRVVHLNHNSAAYEETIGAIEETEKAISIANDYDDLQDKEQRLAELSAARRLLASTRVRVGAVTAIAGPVLGWLAENFAGGIIGQLASTAWKLITNLLTSAF
jgi:hypothetical protein